MADADPEPNKAVVPAFYDALEAHDLERLAELYVPEYSTGEYLGFDDERHEDTLEEDLANRPAFLDAFPLSPTSSPSRASGDGAMPRGPVHRI